MAGLQPKAIAASDSATVFYADVTAKRIVYQGRPCLIGFFRDIMERRKAQAALERERQTLRHPATPLGRPSGRTNLSLLA